jgi:hypothetical protein
VDLVGVPAAADDRRRRAHRVPLSACASGGAGSHSSRRSGVRRAGSAAR